MKRGVFNVHLKWKNSVLNEIGLNGFIIRAFTTQLLLFRQTYNFRHRQILQKELRITTKIRRGQRTKALITKMISPALAEIVCKSHLEHDNLK